MCTASRCLRVKAFVGRDGFQSRACPPKAPIHVTGSVLLDHMSSGKKEHASSVIKTKPWFLLFKNLVFHNLFIFLGTWGLNSGPRAS